MFKHIIVPSMLGCPARSLMWSQTDDPTTLFFLTVPSPEICSWPS